MYPREIEATEETYLDRIAFIKKELTTEPGRKRLAIGYHHGILRSHRKYIPELKIATVGSMQAFMRYTLYVNRFLDGGVAKDKALTHLAFTYDSFPPNVKPAFLDRCLDWLEKDIKDRENFYSSKLLKEDKHVVQKY